MVKFGGHSRAQSLQTDHEGAWLDYTCWACGRDVTGAVIARPKSSETPWNGSATRWLWCNGCGAPAVRSEDGAVRPGARFGPGVDGLPPNISEAYDEARDCMSVSAFTAAELLCRKIIMYVAVDKGLPAKDSKNRAPTFEACIDHLAVEGYVTPPMTPWVDQIRKHGNAATHEIEPPSEDRAKSTVLFTSQMLTNTYGMEHLTKLYAPPPSTPDDAGSEAAQESAS